MQSRHLAILGATALAAIGGGVAVAAIGDDGKETENAILSDAAERLDVEADELRNALSEAQLAQIDRAVEEGKLTEEQGERIKEHMQDSGRVLGFPGGPHGHHGPGGPGGPAVFEAIAKELGISVDKLQEQLMNGKKMRQIARANGKTLADVKAAAKAAIEKQLAEDVEQDRITEEQADQIRENLPRILNHLVRGPRFHRGPGGPRGMDGPPGMGGMGGPGPMGGPPPGAGFGPPPREFSR